MAGKTLVTLFFSSQVMDIISTYIALTYFPFTEVNRITSHLFGNVGMVETMIYKLALSYILIMLYVMSQMKIPFLHNTMKRSLQLGGLGTWMVVFLNTAGILSVVKY